MDIRISPGRIGRWSASHPRRALVSWFVVVVACVALGATAGVRTLSDGEVGGSAQGNAVMDQEWRWEPHWEYAYVHSNTAVSSDPSFAAAVRDVQRRITALGLPVSETASSGRHSVLVSAIDAQNQIVNSHVDRVGLLAIPVTLLVLLLAFVSLVTALVPLLLGLTAVAAGLGLLGQISHAFAVQDSAKTVILLIGLSWLPLFLFVTLFGLSMNYPVFLSRIRKAASGEPARQAIRLSISRSADVITAAALVMVWVVALFGTLASLDLKQAGAGLTLAVLIDATVIRCVLLPATMAVLGEQHGYLPRWLAWLSRLGLEPRALHLDRSGLTLSLPGRRACRAHEVPRPDPDLTGPGYHRSAGHVG